MYKVIEVKSITMILLTALLAILIVSSVSIGLLWTKNQTLRLENAELLKTSTQLVALTERLSHTSNSMIDRVATMGLENMATVNHVCGPQTVKDYKTIATHFTPFSTDAKPDPLSGMPVEMKALEYLDETKQSGTVARKK